MLSSVERVNRRQQIRLKACVPGRFSLADYRDGRGNRRRFACRAIELAETTITCTTAISGRLGDRVIAYFQEFGKFHGPIVQVADEGFVMRIVATDQQRSRWRRTLAWFEQSQLFNWPDRRRHKRVIPENPLSTITFPDGRVRVCFVIDMSSSGAAISTDVFPEVGSSVVVGKVAGTVVRRFDEGFAIQFCEEQDPALLEQRVIWRS